MSNPACIREEWYYRGRLIVAREAFGRGRNRQWRWALLQWLDSGSRITLVAGVESHRYLAFERGHRELRAALKRQAQRAAA